MMWTVELLLTLLVCLIQPNETFLSTFDTVVYTANQNY